MSPIKVYGSLLSSSVTRVLCCLYEKEIEFDFVPVDMRTGQHKKEPHISINPFGQVPGFKDGDLTLFESRAINQYLAYAYPEKGTQLIPSEKNEMGTALTWMSVEAHQYDPPAGKLSYELFVKPKLGIGAADEATVAENEAKLCKVLDIYEARLSKTKYLAGDCFTLADLCHLPNLWNLMNTEAKKLFESRSHVNAWATEILSRPSWDRGSDPYKFGNPGQARAQLTPPSRLAALLTGAFTSFFSGRNSDDDGGTYPKIGKGAYIKSRNPENRRRNSSSRLRK